MQIINSKAIFIAVGTPPGKNHEADLSAVKAVAKSIGQNMNEYKVVIDKSTVPVGTADMVASIIKENQSEKIDFDVVSNPEFLREGEAILDFTNPDRIVIGANSEKARKIMEDIYKGIARVDKPILFTDVKSAEIIKYASNAMLATRISFMNEVAQLCEKVGARR
jgi:UDPglucose 6-dehydrogenase